MTATMGRRVAGFALAVVLVVTASACGSSGERYELEARFDEAIALYQDSDVRVMGTRIGRVTGIDIDGDAILVTMSIRADVPLPADALVTIMPVSLIGERVINFSHPWQPGDERLEPGSRIPESQTIIPVEPDDALSAITDLLTSLQPASIARILEEGAQAIDGTGNTINTTLIELAQLIPYLAQQDEEFAAIADDVHTLAEAIRSRDDEIAKLLDDFATVSTTLAAERDQIVGFVDALASLAREGRALLTAYETTIPEDLDAVASVALTIEANAQSVQQTLLSFQAFQEGVLDAYVDEFGTIHARVQTSGLVMNQLEPIFDLIGELVG